MVRQARESKSSKWYYLLNWEFLKQTDNNADCAPIEDRFKFVDDLTTLEVIKLLSFGLGSYNYKHHIPSDVPTNGHYVENTHLRTKEYINHIS